ncbi:VQ motif-containing protein 31-like [Spinacia oleracea]|uniref:VQ motif-containing protein 31-like n=1 Tax=Spinacia oleracea TaxID=3562 RepID=A0A9R0JLV6_SPIOL|nr:VQ motif-containing protein 31-like [Spinacia oleracea]
MEMSGKKTVNEPKALTTFVQADTTTFKDVVQRLTGSSDAAAAAAAAVHEVTAAKGNIGVKRPEFKLHERRQYKAKLEIIKPPLNIKHGQQHFQEHRFSPSSSGNRVRQKSPMTTPTKIFSSLSLAERGSSRGEPAASELNTQEEEKAIRERRFYLHPSPRSKPGFNEPELLTLFPLTSPKTGEES